MKVLLFFSFALLLSLSACSSTVDVEHYAQEFCACASPIAEAKIQLENGRINKELYKQIERDGEDCLDKEDPFEKITDEKEKLDFKLLFNRKVFELCPSTAIGMGFQQDQ